MGAAESVEGEDEVRTEAAGAAITGGGVGCGSAGARPQYLKWFWIPVEGGKLMIEECSWGCNCQPLLLCVFMCAWACVHADVKLKHCGSAEGDQGAAVLGGGRVARQGGLQAA